MDYYGIMNYSMGSDGLLWDYELYSMGLDGLLWDYELQYGFRWTIMGL